MKREEVKIDRGITDVENVMKYLGDEEKKARKMQWLKENYSKVHQRKPKESE